MIHISGIDYFSLMLLTFFVHPVAPWVPSFISSEIFCINHTRSFNSPPLGVLSHPRFSGLPTFFAPALSRSYNLHCCIQLVFDKILRKCDQDKSPYKWS